MTMHSDPQKSDAASSATQQALWMGIVLVVLVAIALWFFVQ
jgi:hypothetical protein